MKVGEAREVVRKWAVEEASRIPGIQGAYSAGSMNWLSDDAELPASSDVDIMVVLADLNQASFRRKFLYRGVLLEASHLDADRLQSVDDVLGDYHLAASLATAEVLLDPSAHLTSLRAIVGREYAKRPWVRRRCASARDRVLGHLQSIDEAAPLHDQVTACLFAAGVTTHILLVAGLRNPTVRARYLAVRELLADYGRLAFHETLLGLQGAAEISRARAGRHLATLTDVFDVAAKVIKTPFPFVSDLSGIARPLAIEGSLDSIQRGHRREAMFWIAVTHSRCQKVLSHDAPELSQSFAGIYRDLLDDLGIATSSDVRRRCTEVERSLPCICDVAEGIIGENRQIARAP